MKFGILISALVLMVACSSNQTAPILQPIADAGCAVESALTTDFGNAVAQACSGNASACGPAFQVALGNINLCNTPLPAQASPQVQALPALAKLLADHPTWTKVGDIPSSALGGQAGAQVKALVAKPMGIIGTLICPIAVNTALGFLTGQIPTACACTQNLSASSIDAAFVAGCETLTSTLP